MNRSQSKHYPGTPKESAGGVGQETPGGKTWRPTPKEQERHSIEEPGDILWAAYAPKEAIGMSKYKTLPTGRVYYIRITQ